MYNREEILIRIITAVHSDPRIIGLVNLSLSIENILDQWSDIELALIIHNDNFIKFNTGWEEWSKQFGEALIANLGDNGHSWMVYDGQPLPIRIDYFLIPFSKIENIKKLLNFYAKEEYIVYYDQTGNIFSQLVADIGKQPAASDNNHHKFVRTCEDFWYFVLRTYKNLLRKHTWSARYDFNNSILGNLMTLMRLEIRSKVNWHRLNSANGFESLLSSWRKEQLDQCIPTNFNNEPEVTLANVAQLGYEICDSLANENQWGWPSELAEKLIKLLNLNAKTRINLPSINYQPIGYVQNNLNELLAPGKIKAIQSQIIIDPSLAIGLEGLHAGQKIMVVYHLHQSRGYELRQHPRRDFTLPARGVFALRSPQRPNPIGVTIVDLLEIDRNILTVHGLDAINKTPVLDLKLE